MEKRISELKIQKEDLELRLNKSIVNFKMQEDELETVMLVIEHIFAKKKEKFKSSLDKLSNETKNQITKLAQSYKYFK